MFVNRPDYVGNILIIWDLLNQKPVFILYSL